MCYDDFLLSALNHSEWATDAVRTNPKFVLPDEPILPPAILNALTWMMLHHPGTFTLTHHDFAGSVTIIRCLLGYKIWAVLRLLGKVTNMKNLLKKMKAMVNRLEEELEKDKEHDPEWLSKWLRRDPEVKVDGYEKVAKVTIFLLRPGDN
jgi:hypothetical protein